MQLEDKASSSNRLSTKLAALTASRAGFGDVDDFLRLARLYAEERAVPFDEAEARYVFAGIPRAEPAINLLLAGDQAIGFALLRHQRMPFSSARIAREELIFIRADQRSAEAEMLLHAASHAVFDTWAPTVREMLIPTSPYAGEIAVTLAGSGYQPAMAATRCVGKPVEHRESADPLH